MENPNEPIQKDVRSLKPKAKKIVPIPTEKKQEPSSMEIDVPKKAAKNRCAHPECKRRLGFTDIECRCGKMHCGKHRYPDEHNCSFDWKQFDREKLKNANPIVVADKVRPL
eukprot:TRINITY_DN682_c0_g1_i1.p1 TRINITY_DN682_c0_g1~~TRINITY_DN682_c0_g1_i1.p1  ORF type:complete len:111 (-),score=21.23 TRINITY_DN682_c0_g1_i1:50-382(-)